METKNTKVSTLLLVFGLILMLGVGNLKKVDAQSDDDDKICPQFCYDNLDYMTCPSTGDQKLTPSCNCCLAPTDGCILHFNNGDAPIVC
ncbi:proteinase inhibitor PSI-1.2-like [Chenopodium quinoa]|uniref:Uncharacterized protein n=1 Tax=Chenopodium quinoa TaxID=63459 RepID=A0A803M343_CHEQI|nr:proteinase inhibitor PSI-1.2-like [Chenopodium quinoa]